MGVAKNSIILHGEKTAEQNIESVQIKPSPAPEWEFSLHTVLIINGIEIMSFDFPFNNQGRCMSQAICWNWKGRPDDRQTKP